MQRADPQHVARPPVRHVALGERIDSPEPDVNRLGVAGRRTVHPCKLVLNEPWSILRRRCDQVGKSVRGNESREHAIALRPRRPQEVLTSCKAVRSDVRPHRPAVDRDGLGRERHPLGAQ